jgi:hypothetical protein
MTADKRLDRETISRKAFYLPGFDGVEVRRLESGSIEEQEARSKDIRTNLNRSALGRT